MFQPVMTQLLVAAAEAEAMLRATAAVPTAAVAARVTDRRTATLFTGQGVVCAGGHDDPFLRNCFHVCVCIWRMQGKWVVVPRGVQPVLAGVSGLRPFSR